MGLWGSKKVRSRSYSSFYSSDEEPIDIGKTAAFLSGFHHTNFTDEFNAQYDGCFLHKLNNAQRWAQKKFLWGTFDCTTSAKTTTANSESVTEFITQIAGEPVVNVSYHTGSLEPLYLLRNQVLEDYSDWDINNPTIDSVYEYSNSKLEKEGTSTYITATWTNTTDEEDTKEYTVDITDLQIKNQLDTLLYISYSLASDPETTLYYNYDLTSNPLHASFKFTQKSKNKLEYYFLAPLRIENKDLYKSTKESHKKLWNSSKKLISRLGIKPKDLSKQVLTDEGDMGKINEVYLMPGVPISSTANYINKYVFEFFKYIYKSYGSNGFIKLQDYLSGILLEWGTITRDRVAHKGKIGKITKKRENGRFIVMKNVSTEYAIQYSIQGLHLTDIICNEEAITEDLPENLYDADYIHSGGFILPLNRVVLNKLSINDRNRVAMSSIRLVFDYHDKVSKSFFESAIGKLIATLVFKPMEIMKKLGLRFLLFGTLGLVFGTFLKHTAIGKFVNKVVALAEKLEHLPMQLTIRFLFRLIGVNGTIIVATLVSIVLAVYGQGDKVSMIWKLIIQQIISEIFNALNSEITRDYRKSMRRISKDMQSLQEEMDEFREELDMHKNLSGISTTIMQLALLKSAFNSYVALSGRTYELLTKMPTDVQDAIDNIFDWQKNFLMNFAITPDTLILGNMRKDILLA